MHVLEGTPFAENESITSIVIFFEHEYPIAKAAVGKRRKIGYMTNAGGWHVNVTLASLWNAKRVSSS